MATRRWKAVMQAAAVTGALAALPVLADPIPIDLGPADIEALSTTADLDNVLGGWTINLDTDPDGPFTLQHQGEGGYWQKLLSYDGVVPGAPVFLSETFTIGYVVDESVDPPALVSQFWSDWHETIMTEGWVWDTTLGVTVSVTGGDGALSSFVFDGTATVADLYFDPLLESGDTVTIMKWLKCVGDLDLCLSGGTVEVRQYPTIPPPPPVPEPMTSALLGLGLLGLGMARRRKAS